MTTTLPADVQHHAAADGLAARGRAAALAAGLGTAAAGGGGVALGLGVLLGHPRAVHVGWLLPLIGLRLSFDPLGAFFLLVTGAVAIAVGIYAGGYLRREPLPTVSLLVLPVYVAAMLLVPVAGSISTFLLAWELMAVASLVLVLSEHDEPRVRAAGQVYAVLSQLGFLALPVGLLCCLPPPVARTPLRR